MKVCRETSLRKNGTAALPVRVWAELVIGTWKTNLICFYKKNAIVHVTKNEKLLKKGNVIIAHYTNHLGRQVQSYNKEKSEKGFNKKMDITEFGGLRRGNPRFHHFNLHANFT